MRRGWSRDDERRAARQERRGDELLNYYTLDFDTTTQEIVWATFVMPSDWDGGTITAEFEWTATGTSTNNVQWEIAGRSYGDSETLDQAMAPCRSSRTRTPRRPSRRSGRARLRPSPSPDAAAGELVFLRIRRDVANDNLAVDAKLIGCVINYTRT